MKKLNKKLIRQLAVFLLLVGICIPVISLAYGRESFVTKEDEGFRIQKSSKEITPKNLKQMKEELREEHVKILEKLELELEDFNQNGESVYYPEHIFYPTYRTGISADALDMILEGTGLEDQGKYFVEVERRYGVNALFILAMANHESFYGDSNIAREKNNLFGFNAYDIDPKYHASSYDSYGECILDVGMKVKKFYLSEDGQFFKGFSAKSMNYYYATDSSWGDKINWHMTEIGRKLLEQTGELYK